MTRMTDEKVHQLAQEFLKTLVAELQLLDGERDVNWVEHGHKGWFDLMVGDVKVPLRFEEETHTHHGGFNWTYTGKLKLLVEELRKPNSWRKRTVDRKYFLTAAKRKHGFDVPKLVAHIEKWATAYVVQEKATAERETANNQWDTVLDHLKASYPEAAKKLELEATPQGIKMKAVLGQKDLEAILAAL